METLENDPNLRQSLGIMLYNHIEASNMATGDLRERWDKNEALYNQDHNESSLNIVDGLATYPIPLWAQKADRIVGTVFQGITGIEPYVQVLTDDGENERADDIEKALMVMANRGATNETFDRAFLQSLQIAVNTNISFIYAYMKDEGQVCFKAVHPKDFVGYPHELVDLNQMVTIGHRFYMMRSTAQARIDKGEYLPGTLGSNTSVSENETGKSADFSKVGDTGAIEPKDEILTFYQLLYRGPLEDGGEDKVVRFTFCYDTQEVFKAEDYPYENAWYFPVKFADEYNSLWPASSPGWRMQALQKAYTDIVNTIIGGAYATAFPILCFIGGAMPTKMKRTTVGAIYELPAGIEVVQIKPQVDFGFLAQMLQVIENAADGVTRISALGTSQNMPSGTTATAASGFLKAQEEGKDQYTSFVAPVVADVWRFLYELLVAHFDTLKKLHKDAIQLESVDELADKPMRFEPTGKSAETNPRVLLEKLQMMLGMASSPESQLDYRRVEDQVVQGLNIPQDIKSLQKDEVSVSEEIVQMMLETGLPPEQLVQILSGMAQMMAGGGNGQMGSGGMEAVPGDQAPPLDPAMAGIAGPMGNGTDGNPVA